jgi:hypothetical protein
MIYSFVLQEVGRFIFFIWRKLTFIPIYCNTFVSFVEGTKVYVLFDINFRSFQYNATFHMLRAEGGGLRSIQRNFTISVLSETKRRD